MDIFTEPTNTENTRYVTICYTRLWCFSGIVGEGRSPGTHRLIQCKLPRAVSLCASQHVCVSDCVCMYIIAYSIRFANSPILYENRKININLVHTFIHIYLALTCSGSLSLCLLLQLSPLSPPPARFHRRNDDT